MPMQAPRFDAAYLRNPPPAYPRASRRLGEEGRVVLRVRVERDGSPSRLEVQASSGSSRLDEAAFDAVRHWHFVAARRGDDNVAAWVLVPIEFRLDNG
jgi:protein TonB